MNIGKVRANIAATITVLEGGTYEPGIMKKELRSAFKELEYTKVKKFCKYAATRFADRLTLLLSPRARKNLIKDLSDSLMQSFKEKGKDGI